MKTSNRSAKGLGILYAVLAVLAGLLPLAGWLAGGFWFCDLFNHFQLQYAGFIAAMLVLLVSRKAWRLAALAALFLIVPLARIAPLLLPAGGKPGGKAIVRVLSFNVLTSNKQYGEVLEWLRATDPDLAFFPEADERWSEELSPLLASHPYKVEHFEGWNFGSVFYSKLPILAHEIIPCGSSGLPYLKVKLQTADGTFTFYGAHPIPPIDGEHAGDRDAYLKTMADDVAAEPGVVIVAGDLNATPWSRAMEPLFSAGLQGGSLSPTWRRGNPMLAIPIDHLLYRGAKEQPERIHSSKRRVGPDLGSDHRGLVAEIAW